MPAEYRIIFKIGKYFLAEQLDPNSNPRYKHICYFFGEQKYNCFSFVFKATNPFLKKLINN